MVQGELNTLSVCVCTSSLVDPTRPKEHHSIIPVDFSTVMSANLNRITSFIDPVCSPAHAPWLDYKSDVEAVYYSLCHSKEYAAQPCLGGLH
jgi:hypothetical protein